MAKKKESATESVGLALLTKKYGNVITWALHHRRWMIAFAIVSFIGAIFLQVKFGGSSFFPKADANEFRGKVGAARALSKMKTWTRRVTRTRDNARLKKIVSDSALME